MSIENELNPETVRNVKDRFEQIRPSIRKHRELILSAGSLCLGLAITHQAIKFVLFKHYRFNMLIKPVLALGFYYATEPVFMAYRSLTRHCSFESFKLSLKIASGNFF